MSTSLFLSTILPAEGLRCVLVLVGKMPKQHFFATNEEAAKFALRQKRGEVYHACATFKDSSSRKAENVQALRSLWLDVDCGSDKRYLDRSSALRALRSFLEQTGLPQPCVVGSGGGLHLYWPLRDSLLPHEWLGYARGLKAQCELRGFAADPSRTADAASILRPVGTWNRKNPDEPRQVVWTGPVGPYEIEAFEALKLPNPIGLGQRPSYLPLRTSFSFDAAKVETRETTPSDANEVANRCAQIGVFRDTKGLLPETLWKSCLGVVAWCEEGVSKSHAWSMGDPRYDPAETQGKIDRLLKLTGPTRCETFKGLNPEGCKACRFALDISSPIELGRPPYTPVRETPRVGGDLPPTEVQVPTHPVGFCCTEEGLYFASEDKDGKHVTKHVSRTKFHLLRISEVDNDQEGTHYVFRIEHKFDGTRDVSVAAGHAHGTQSSARMAGLGVPIENGDLFRTYLNAAAAGLRAKGKAAVTYKQYGYKNGNSVFLVGDRLYSSGGVVPGAIVGEAQQRAKYFPIQGTLDGWSGAANMLCAKGCEAQQFAILASAAAPLMKLMAADEGGAIYSQASRDSATGKSTSFDAAQSFWGQKDGLAIGSMATANARGIVLATNCNLPVFFDEASQRDAEELRGFLQVFTDGIDRQRANQHGQLQQNPLTWQTVLLCGSNVPMLDVLGSAGGSEAMMYRVLEVTPSLPEGLSSSGEKVRRQMKANCGNAGDRYMRYLMRPNVQQTTITWLEKMYDEIETASKFDRKARFIIRLLAAVRVAGEMLKRADILACNPQGMMEWGIEKALRQVEDTATLATTGALTGYLNYYHDDILTVLNEGRKLGSVLHEPRNQLRGRYETETRQLYIALPPFRKWLAEHDYSWNETRTKLEKDGLLSGVKLVTLTAGTNKPGGQIQCIQLNAAALGFCFDAERKILEFKK